MTSCLIKLSIVIVAGLVIGCNVQTDSRQGQPYVPYVTDQIVINDLKLLNDGAFITWQLEPGHYKLEMTANNDGASAEWVGANCPKTQQMRQLAMECLLPTAGSL